MDSSSPMARCFSGLKRHSPCLIAFKPGLMLRVCSTTSRETPGISVRLHTNRSLFPWRKTMSSLSYFGSRLAQIYTVLARISVSICMALASSSALQAPNVRGIPGLCAVMGNRRLSSLSSSMTTVAVASSMLLCSQFSARCIWASTVMILAGLGILSLR
jgi:hypothetical protein